MQQRFQVLLFFNVTLDHQHLAMNVIEMYAECLLKNLWKDFYSLWHHKISKPNKDTGNLFMTKLLESQHQ